jgi:hypothetical protein
MVTTVAIIGVIVVFLSLGFSAYAIYLDEKGRGELRFR